MKVKILMVSARGHDVLEMEPEAALTRLQDEVRNGKWLYIDGNLKEDVAGINLNDIVQAENIQLANGLVGG